MEKRKITLQGWSRSGEGATAVSYNNDSDPHQMPKVFSSSIIGPQYASTEYELSGNVSGLGLRTPCALELVDCDGFSAIIYERIVNKRSISRLCASAPEDLEHWAGVFAHECAVLHSTSCSPDRFISRKEQMLAAMNSHRGYSDRTRKMIAALAGELSDRPTCLHGDLQTGNLIVDSDTGVTYWIDLGSFAYGDPMFDLACLYFFCKHPVGRFVGRRLCHMSFARLGRFWDVFAAVYGSETGRGDLQDKAARYVPLYLVYTIGLENYTGLTSRVFDAYINCMRVR